MVDGVVGLHGKAYNGTPYTVNVQVLCGKVKTIILCGRPCKPVKDIVEDFANMNASIAENVVDSIKITMLQHNEYVQTVRA